MAKDTKTIVEADPKAAEQYLPRGKKSPDQIKAEAAADYFFGDTGEDEEYTNLLYQAINADEDLDDDQKTQTFTRLVGTIVAEEYVDDNLSLLLTPDQAAEQARQAKQAQ